MLAGFGVCVRAVRVGRKERTLAGLGVCVCEVESCTPVDR